MALTTERDFDDLRHQRPAYRHDFVYHADAVDVLDPFAEALPLPWQPADADRRRAVRVGDVCWLMFLPYIVPGSAALTRPTFLQRITPGYRHNPAYYQTHVSQTDTAE